MVPVRIAIVTQGSNPWLTPGRRAGIATALASASRYLANVLPIREGAMERIRSATGLILLPFVVATVFLSTDDHFNEAYSVGLSAAFDLRTRARIPNASGMSQQEVAA
jgi:hypothetical protein